MAATLDQARTAKEAVASALKHVRFVTGIGIAVTDDGYEVKVNLERPSKAALPATVEGVPVRYEVVGKIRKQK